MRSTPSSPPTSRRQERSGDAPVTAWQLRSDGGSPIPNDHSDAAYDQRVLGDLQDLHGDVAPWLADQATGLERLSRYAQRLGHALGSVVAGDVRFVASPRVDSYHGAWFELHEDLMLLAGRSRADEVAAGRA